MYLFTKYKPLIVKLGPVIAVAVAVGIFSIIYSMAGNTQKQYRQSLYQTISPEDAKAKIDEGGVVLLDVRSAEEYEESHIPGAVLLPLPDIEKSAQKVLKDKYATILVYCRSGARSKTATEALLQLGYLGVLDLGGIIDWPYATESGPAQ